MGRRKPFFINKKTEIGAWMILHISLSPSIYWLSCGTQCWGNSGPHSVCLGHSQDTLQWKSSKSIKRVLFSESWENNNSSHLLALFPPPHQNWADSSRIRQGLQWSKAQPWSYSGHWGSPGINARARWMHKLHLCPPEPGGWGTCQDHVGAPTSKPECVKRLVQS